MNQFKLSYILIAVGITLSPLSVLADTTTTQQAPHRQGGGQQHTVQEMKDRILAHINERIQDETKVKSCVEAAQTKEALIGCRELAKEMRPQRPEGGDMPPPRNE